MNFKVGITLLFHCGLIIFHIENYNACNHTATVGDSLTIPLMLKNLNTEDETKWKHDTKLIFKKRAGKLENFTTTAQVTEAMHLKINNATEMHRGQYTVEVFDSKGTARTKEQYLLCVSEKLPKPVVNVTCDNGKPRIKCEVKDSRGQIFIWYQNGIKQSEEKDTLSGKTAVSYVCAVEKPVKSHESDSVTANCVQKRDTLFGFDFWVMVGILAGGGGLVLLLMIVLVTCACQSCKRQEKHLRDEEELRLNFHTPPQRSKNTARGQPAPPVPQEDPEVSNYEVDEAPHKAQTKVKNQPRIRPPPPPIDEDEQPPPLPQPRKKIPHNKKNQGPLYMQP